MRKETQKKWKYRDLENFPPEQRASQLWLTIDDILKIIPISRTLFWKMVDEGSFAAPYLWRKGMLWTRSDVRDWIVKKAQNFDDITINKTPATWNAIEKLLANDSDIGMTNKEIAYALNSIEADIASLTRLMAKARVLLLLQPIRKGAGAPHFYVHAKHYNDNAT